ncbi:hypothetical protein POL68_24040 [Stigmatella sp. ncwal1]|uniref:Uncharacterized protein n=1 Tax=Stigmatella ashevillensis TaxID=2995309 RepID=A0ABT5DD19_9BACT|nr:hypothetical protein [Stigmatella ashevillena]MDC0711562.1 hypothetical protein [Stigmatella ashevillena]
MSKRFAQIALVASVMGIATAALAGSSLNGSQLNGAWPNINWPNGVWLNTTWPNTIWPNGISLSGLEANRPQEKAVQATGVRPRITAITLRDGTVLRAQ